MNKSEVSLMGTLNGHAVGIVMKELVRRAIMAIRNQKQAFEVQVKESYAGKMDDMLTSADKEAQRVYLRSIHECFPTWGVIAEEDSYIRNCSDNSGLFFTIDPLDGTKAFVRRQSHGVGTMISLSREKEFVAAYVGDVNTQEIYGFRPGSNKVHRITEFNTCETLSIQAKPLKDSYVLLRDPEALHSPLSQRLIKRFKNIQVDGGSIGTWIARLWKGEVAAAIIPPSWETPWDSNPVNAISQRLGLVFMAPSDDGKQWEPYSQEPTQIKFRRNHDILIIPRVPSEDVAEINT